MLVILIAALIVTAFALGHALAFTNSRPSLSSAPTNAVSAALSRWLGTDLAEIPLLAALATIVVAGSWAFWELMEHVVMGDAIIGLDAKTFAALTAARTSTFDAVFVALTQLADVEVAMPVFVVALVALLAWKRWRAALFLAGGVIGAAVFVGGIKGVIARPRPVSIYDGVIDYSFPSGHACMSIVLYATLAFLLCQGASQAWRRTTITAALIFIGMVSLSRMYLGAHWLSDVLAGLAFGAAWVAGLALIYRHHTSQPVRRGELAIIIIMTVIVAGGIHIARDYNGEVKRYSHALTPQSKAPR